jgi:hypothetical protein
MIRQAFPSRALTLLLLIGLVDLTATAVLHAQGKISELNPLMRGFIERSEWLFVAVKGLSLVFAYVMLVRCSRTHRDFVTRAGYVGAALYVGIWLTWFLHGPGS